ISCRWSKLNNGLEGPTVRNIGDYVFRNVGLRDVCGHVDLWSCRGYLDDCRCSTKLERQIDQRKVSNLENQSISLYGLEALCCDRDCVCTWRKVGEAIVTVCVCLKLFAAHKRTSGNYNLSVRY